MAAAVSRVSESGSAVISAAFTKLVNFDKKLPRPVPLPRSGSSPPQRLRRGVFRALRVHGDGLDFLGGLGPVVAVARLGDDGVHHVQPLEDLAEGGVLPVEV